MKISNFKSGFGTFLNQRGIYMVNIVKFETEIGQSFIKNIFMWDDIMKHLHRGINAR